MRITNENYQFDFILAFYWSPGGVGEVAYGAQETIRVSEIVADRQTEFGSLIGTFYKQ
jgi:hypothetical protein